MPTTVMIVGATLVGGLVTGMGSYGVAMDGLKSIANAR